MQTRAQPTPIVAEASPPSDMPATVPALRPIRTRAFACRTRPGGTVCGVSAAEAGSDTAAKAPLNRLRPTSSGTVAKPSSTLRATRNCTSAAAAVEPCRISARGSRSASTPPTSSTTTLAMDRAPTTTPRSVVEPVRSSTANASTIGAMAPTREVRARPATIARKPP